MVPGIPHSYCAPPVMNYQRTFFDVQMAEGCCQIVDMIPESVRIILGFLRKAATHIIHSNNPVIPGQKVY